MDRPPSRNLAMAQPVSTAHALWRGFTMKCPNCGTGRLFRQFLKVVDHCSVCGEELHHHRADDFPAYIVILVVGHTLVPAALAFEMDYAPPMWLDFFDLDPAHDCQRVSTSAAHEGGGRRDAIAARNAWLRAIEIAAARPDPPVRSHSRRLHASVGRNERS